ncbi:hypothetical protein QE368_000865 [Asaia bogorensis NBRC 16594]|nr:hypothetical protein [Asaia bogorensis NBRC 16594]
MKNPVKPGVFGTNGTQGVVGSGMSETTKRAIPTDLMDTGTRWAERVDATHLIAKPVPYHAARANLRAAEGGAELGTTNSPAEIGAGCTGRKMALLAGQCAALVLSFALIGFIALWIDRKEGLLCTVISVTISAAVSWYLWPPVVVRRRGPGGERV